MKNKQVHPLIRKMLNGHLRTAKVICPHCGEPYKGRHKPWCRYNPEPDQVIND